LLGTMRTGPDLMNIGVRQPSEAWHLGHLYQPRAFVPGSIMPSYPYLFALRERAEKDEVVVIVPGTPSADGRVVVASREALDLVSYLRSLDRSYPIDTDGATPSGKK
jgi:cytochrome c oxidase cbb3-type subunit II